MNKSNNTKQNKAFTELLHTPAVKMQILDFLKAINCHDHTYAEKIKDASDVEAFKDITLSMFCEYSVGFGPKRIFREGVAKYMSQFNALKLLYKSVDIEIHPLNVNDCRVKFTKEESAVLEDPEDWDDVPDLDVFDDQIMRKLLLRTNKDGSITDCGFFSYGILLNGAQVMDIKRLLGRCKKKLGRNIESPNDLIEAIQLLPSVDYDILSFIQFYFPCVFPDGSDNTHLRAAMYMMGLDPDFSEIA